MSPTTPLRSAALVASILAVHLTSAPFCLGATRTAVIEPEPEPDLELLPVSPLPDTPYDGATSSTGPTIRLTTIPGLGGRTPAHGPWDGHAALITDSSPDKPWRGLEILPPLGGCSTKSGDLTRTSANALENKCDLAVNGSPFSKGGGCIGQSLSDGAKVCDDCPPWEEIPTLGLILSSSDEEKGGMGKGTATEGRNITAAQTTWVVGTGLTYDLAQSMGVSNSIVGHVPGWLVRSGVVVPDAEGGQIAPRTSVGITPDGRTLILLVVDGCEHCPNFMGGPKGLTVREAAEQMIRLGAWHAINLDGGGSSTMAHGGRVVNFPTGWGVPLGPFWKERAVSTAICIRLDEGEGEQDLE